MRYRAVTPVDSGLIIGMLLFGTSGRAVLRFKFKLPSFKFKLKGK